MTPGLASVLSLAALIAGAGSDHRSPTAFSHALSQFAGARLRVDLVDVTYAPGASSGSHSHHCPAIVYVLDGAIVSQTRGSAAATYTAGQGFYEAAGVEHVVSKNASSRKTARFIAYFICKHGEHY
ncbi:MAG: cupin domain-containing protein [Vulcanimicrobiaceae bacterium]